MSDGAGSPPGRALPRRTGYEYLSPHLRSGDPEPAGTPFEAFAAADRDRDVPAVDDTPPTALHEGRRRARG